MACTGLPGRIALQDHTFSDGTYIPKGAVVAAPVNAIQYDESHYPNAHEFQGFRFLDAKNDTEGDSSSRRSFVSQNPEYFPFGYGNHACPGRFFAASTMKLMLSYMLVHYDFRLESGATPGGGKRPEDFLMGTLRMPNRHARLLVRERAKD